MCSSRRLFCFEEATAASSNQLRAVPPGMFSFVDASRRRLCCMPASCCCRLASEAGSWQPHSSHRIAWHEHAAACITTCLAQNGKQKHVLIGRPRSSTFEQRPFSCASGLSVHTQVARRNGSSPQNRCTSLLRIMCIKHLCAKRRVAGFRA